MSMNNAFKVLSIASATMVYVPIVPPKSKYSKGNYD
jgi:hypothetical protein